MRLYNIISLFTIAFGLFSTVFNAFSISLWNKDKEKFNKLKPMIIISIILNFILIFIEITFIILVKRYVWFTVGSIIACIMMLATNVLAIIDIAREGVAQTTDKKEKASSEGISFECKMKKLAEMKNDKLIDEKEFEILKKSFIEDELGKTTKK